MARRSIDLLSEVPRNDLQVESLVQGAVRLIQSSFNQAAHRDVLDWAIVEKLILDKVAKVLVEIVALGGAREAEAGLQISELLLLVLFEECSHVVRVQKSHVVFGGLLQQITSLTRSHDQVQTIVKLKESAEFRVGEEHAVKLGLSDRLKSGNALHHQFLVAQDRILTPLNFGHVLLVERNLLLKRRFVEQNLVLLLPNHSDNGLVTNDLVDRG